MNVEAPENPCEQIGALLVFYVCDEVNEDERAVIEQHLSACAPCRLQLAEEQAFQKVVNSFAQRADQTGAASILLAQCRSELAERLDDLEQPPAKEKTTTLGWLRGWMLRHPAWSAATLILFGLAAGTEYSRWANAPTDELSNQVVNVRPNAGLTEEQLSKMAVAGINFSPAADSGAQNVRVRLNAEQPIELNGNADDSSVRSVMTFVVKSGDRFDSDVRLNCLDALKTHASDSAVRAALLTAARKDQNPAVRLKALEALHDSSIDNDVRETLLDALQHDSNPGVRVEAVNLLIRALEQAQGESQMLPSGLPHPQEMPAAPIMQASTSAHAGAEDSGSIQDVIRALQTLEHNDPSRYVRLRSAAALHEISARNDQ
jgi:HEAT repeats/Putative zinc-finger